MNEETRFAAERTILRRSLWYMPEEEMNGSAPDIFVENDRREVDSLDEATLVGSLSRDVGWATGAPLHMPVIDIDFPIAAVPSKTKGHYHLYLQKSMTWEQYVVLLSALAFAGIIEPGYFNTSIRRKQTFVRTAPLKTEEVA